MLNQDKKGQLIALNIVHEEMNKYQKSLNMPVWVDICSAGCDNRASFAATELANDFTVFNV
ncbi:hypothetical protein AWE74_25080 [Escherichia coli]|nr:hypothetical protein AWE74_25080 [Escherichia coli]